MSDVAGLDAWLPGGIFSKFPASVGLANTSHTRGAGRCLYSQKCSLQANPSCNQGNRFQMIKVWLFLGTEGMCASKKWNQAMGKIAARYDLTITPLITAYNVYNLSSVLFCDFRSRRHSVP